MKFWQPPSQIGLKRHFIAFCSILADSRWVRPQAGQARKIYFVAVPLDGPALLKERPLSFHLGRMGK
jgi:hypothetical protein